MSVIIIRPAPQPALDDYKAAVVMMLDAKAQERGYDDRLSIATYISSKNTDYAAEAQCFVDWRDQIWTLANAELRKVEAGQRTQPTIAEFLAELPAIVWPASHDG